MKMTAKEKKIIGELVIGTESKLVTNRYSGVSIELNPEQLVIYNIVIDTEKELNYQSMFGPYISKKDMEKLVDLFYAAKDVFVQNWPKEYMILLD